jgi:acetolactate synthase-1/2/3 large subunit
MIGRGAFQETDMIGVTLPIVKHSYLVTDINDIPAS